MNATKQVIEQTHTIEEKFTLELSFTEMHIIMNAISTYAYKHGYGQWNTSAPNDSHAAAAEKLHEELTEIYTS
jgi:hypothetical protein